MRDINFFDPYIEKKDIKFDKKLLVFISLSLALIFLFGYITINQLHIMSLNKEVEYLRETAENPIILAKVEEVQAKELEVNTFREEVNKIKELDHLIGAGDIIDEDLLLALSSKMPEDLFFTNFSTYNREIQISGISKDKISIAEFAKGLTSINYIDSVFVNNITAESDFYNFNINILLEEVIYYGDQSQEAKSN